MLTPAIFAVIPNTTTMKKIIAKYTRIINLPNGINEDKPNVATVFEINANTPIGANFIIVFVTQNIASATPCANAKTGLPLSPIDATPRPNNTEKKIIGNISPFAIDDTTFVGTMLMIVSMIP